MATEAGLPMHLAGLGMTTASNFILPAGIPLSIAFLLTTSNPGEIEAAGEEWKKVGKKLDELNTELDKINSFPEEYWKSDDRDAFALALKKYKLEVVTLRDAINGTGTVLGIAAWVYFALCALVLTVGIILLYMAVVATAYMCVPFGQAVAVAMNAAVAAKVAAILPTIATFKAGVVTFVAFMTATGAAIGGAYGLNYVNLGGGEADFTKATVDMPGPPSGG